MQVGALRRSRPGVAQVMSARSGAKVTRRRLRRSRGTVRGRRGRRRLVVAWLMAFDISARQQSAGRLRRSCPKPARAGSAPGSQGRCDKAAYRHSALFCRLALKRPERSPVLEATSANIFWMPSSPLSLELQGQSALRPKQSYGRMCVARPGRCTRTARRTSRSPLSERCCHERSKWATD